jgi:hypothetical protein
MVLFGDTKETWMVHGRIRELLYNTLTTVSIFKVLQDENQCGPAGI